MSISCKFFNYLLKPRLFLFWALFNLLWNWLLTDKGENVLWDADDEDRYPDFRLYEVIARSCYNAVPSEQFSKEPFVSFKVGSATLPEGAKVYDI